MLWLFGNISEGKKMTQHLELATKHTFINISLTLLFKNSDLLYFLDFPLNPVTIWY